ncbi:uncharacterized protein N7479_000851 [Penicillium vulpinum]|uniref:F-box domain-containing protein n=1 Tax=Penicillium vulpinum TaxID=29845 RepID=A0A1V6S7G3_9EURO|nr:uncharacterized protein N7479_000851 [Penicillium vulpinum]KAJ5970933.1 hypothetical protein N7479_000851 [Penicillium vulpinum]OQE09543.1 hypothetical protein PENVUL_c006G03986 [Penicillium vulpinum]
MNIILDPEQLSWGQAYANNCEPTKLLERLAKYPHIPTREANSFEGVPLPEAIIFEEEGTTDLGTLRCLPNEVVDMIVNKLDVPSAISLSYVNRTANVFVQNSSFSFLRRWTPGLPKILEETQIHKNWSICELKDAIRRETCMSCGDPAVQLFLPTMERICHACTHDNTAYWCLPIEQAGLIFALDLPDIIDFRTIYLSRLSLNGQGFGDLGAWVVPVKAVLARALEVYGSRKAIKRAAEDNSSSSDEDADADVEEGIPNNDEFVVENQNDIYRAASLTINTSPRYSPDLPDSLEPQSYRHDVVCWAPVVPHGNTRTPLQMCRGCTAMLTHPRIRDISDSHMKMMGLDPEIDALERGYQIYRRTFRMRSETEMIQHVRTECLGGWILLYAECLNEGLPWSWE